MTTALLVVGILVLLIVAHELGHFIVAKIFDVRVEEFGVGYPPRAFRFAKIGGTEYTLNWIPFGGFVRLFGDIGEKEHGAGSLVDANRGVQALILVAGVAANALVAWLLFASALHVGIPRVVEHPEGSEFVHLIVANVLPGAPADTAGIVQGDEILGVEDSRGNVPELTPAGVSEFIGTHGGEAVNVTYLHSKTTTTLSVIPAHAVITENPGRPALGIAIVLVSERPLPWGEAFREAFSATQNAFKTVVQGLGGMLARLLSGAPSLSGVVGPIGLVGIVGDASASGIGEVLKLAAFISVNLAIINLIPIPALDGGRLVLLGIEALMRRPAPRLTLQILNALGIALIIFLMITVSYNDIARLIG